MFWEEVFHGAGTLTSLEGSAWPVPASLGAVLHGCHLDFWGEGAVGFELYLKISEESLM